MLFKLSVCVLWSMHVDVIVLHATSMHDEVIVMHVMSMIVPPVVRDHVNRCCCDAWGVVDLKLWWRWFNCLT